QGHEGGGRGGRDHRQGGGRGRARRQDRDDDGEGARRADPRLRDPRRRRVKALLGLLIAFAPAAYAQQDVGLVSLAAGEVGVQAGAAKPFMKVREGDRFELGAGAELRLIYFAGARQESWRGPAALRAGKQESTLERGSPPKVGTLPATAPQRLARIPELA